MLSGGRFYNSLVPKNPDPDAPLWVQLGAKATRIKGPDHLFGKCLNNFQKLLGTGLTRPQWIFRGETINEGLTTTLERAIDAHDNGITLSSAFEIERRLLREFKRRAHHYLSDLPKDHELLEWWALMQHYGAPTRLLDWTYSPYAALFFALNRNVAARFMAFPPSPAYVLWVLNAKWIVSRAKELLGLGKERDDIFRQDGTEFQARRFESFFTRSHKIPGPLPRVVYPVNPFRLNERLTIQRGLFLCASDIRHSFVDNLKAVDPSHPDCFAFLIDADHRGEILEELERMNMNSATLFPGLEGFSRSLWTKSLMFEGDGV